MSPPKRYLSTKVHRRHISEEGGNFIHRSEEVMPRNETQFPGNTRKYKGFQRKSYTRMTSSLFIAIIEQALNITHLFVW